MPRINALPPIPEDIADDDVFPLHNQSTGDTEKSTFTILKTYLLAWMQALTAWISKEMINFDSGIWWEELGVTTLATNASTITVSGFTAKKHLKIRIFCRPNANMSVSLRFNNDSGANYARRNILDTGSVNSVTSDNQAIVTPTLNSGFPYFIDIEIANPDNTQKLGVVQQANSLGNAAVAPERTNTAIKYVTNTQVTRVDVIASTSTFAVDSKVVVLGHD